MYFELTSQQQKAIDKIYNQAINGDLVHFYEGEPGSGKTTIMLHAALKIADNLNRPVVIATNNNSLVMQLAKELGKFKMLDENKDRFISLLGAENYIAPQRMSFYLEDLKTEIQELKQKIDDDSLDSYQKTKIKEDIQNQKRFVTLARKWLDETLQKYKDDPQWNGTYYHLENFLLSQGLITFDDELQHKICFKFNMSVKRHQEKEWITKGEVRTLEEHIKDERMFYDHACKQIQLKNNSIILTNHHLVLLALALNRKSFIFNFDVDNRKLNIGFLILDEAHTLVDAMQLLLSSSFAPLYLRGRITSLLKDDKLWNRASKYRGMKSLKNNLIKLRQFITVKKDIYCNPEQAGETLAVNILENPKLFKFHKKWLEELYNFGKKVKKYLNTLLEVADKEEAKLINATAIELIELENIIKAISGNNLDNEYSSRGTIFVSYSQKLGNPSYSIAFDSAYFKLKNSFWKNIKRYKLKTALVSGTFFVKKGEENPLITVGIAKPSTGIADLETLIGREVEKWYYIIPSNFKKREMMDVVIEDGIRPPNIQSVNSYDEKEQLKQEWFDKLAERINEIYTNRPYRTLILLGSFEDCENLGRVLVERYSWLDSGPGRILWYCSRNFSTNAILREFLRVENGVLIGMKKFWTGFDIPNLINQIVARLPWDCPNHIKWLTIKETFRRTLGREHGYFPLYRRAMLLDFKQGCGRLIRFKKPDVPVKPTLFILDERIKDEQTNHLSLENMLKLAYGEILGG